MPCILTLPPQNVLFLLRVFQLNVAQHYTMCRPKEMMPHLVSPLLPLVSGWLNQLRCKLLNLKESSWLFLFILQSFRFWLLLMILPQVSYSCSVKWDWLRLVLANFSCLSLQDQIWMLLCSPCQMKIQSLLKTFCLLPSMQMISINICGTVKSVFAILNSMGCPISLFFYFFIDQSGFSSSWDIGQSLLIWASSLTSPTVWGSSLLTGWSKLLRNTSCVQRLFAWQWIIWTASSPTCLFSEGNYSLWGLLQSFWLRKWKCEGCKAFLFLFFCFVKSMKP